MLQIDCTCPPVCPLIFLTCLPTFLLQKPYTFAGTLRDQLLFGPPSSSGSSADDSSNDYSTDSLLVELLHSLSLGHLLSRFPGGLDARLDWGSVLSLGEQQRIALARLLHRRPQLAFLGVCGLVVVGGGGEGTGREGGREEGRDREGEWQGSLGARCCMQHVVTDPCLCSAVTAPTASAHSCSLPKSSALPNPLNPLPTACTLKPAHQPLAWHTCARLTDAPTPDCPVQMRQRQHWTRRQRSRHTGCCAAPALRLSASATARHYCVITPTCSRTRALGVGWGCLRRTLLHRCQRADSWAHDKTGQVPGAGCTR